MGRDLISYHYKKKNITTPAIARISIAGEISFISPSITFTNRYTSDPRSKPFVMEYVRGIPITIKKLAYLVALSTYPKRIPIYL